MGSNPVGSINMNFELFACLSLCRSTKFGNSHINCQLDKDVAFEILFHEVEIICKHCCIDPVVAYLRKDQ